MIGAIHTRGWRSEEQLSGRDLWCLAECAEMRTPSFGPGSDRQRSVPSRWTLLTRRSAVALKRVLRPSRSGCCHRWPLRAIRPTSSPCHAGELARQRASGHPVSRLWTRGLVGTRNYSSRSALARNRNVVDNGNDVFPWFGRELTGQKCRVAPHGLAPPTSTLLRNLPRRMRLRAAHYLLRAVRHHRKTAFPAGQLPQTVNTALST